MSITLTHDQTLPKPHKTVETVPFEVRGVVTITIGSQLVDLHKREFGGYDVYLQTAPALRRRIGYIVKDGTGWSAWAWDAEKGEERREKFTGDHFPIRTGKHTQTYALAFLIAIVAGQSQSAATYDLKYEGVKA